MNAFEYFDSARPLACEAGVKAGVSLRIRQAGPAPANIIRRI